MPADILDKVAIVTGGTGSLGKHIVQKLAGEGMKVYVPSRSLTEFNNIFDRSQGNEEESFKLKRIFSFVCDAIDESSVKEFIENVSVQENGNINILINTVGGISKQENVMDMSLETLDNMISLNLKSTFFFTKECLKVMKAKNYGRIISIGAIAALEPTSGRFAYSLSKAGIVNLMDTVSEEMKDYNIRCNTIIPGIIDTDSNREWGSDKDIKKWVKPEEIADIIYDLTSDVYSSVRQSLIKIYGSY
ncbi:MAG: SDR family oxidoreductase [Ignavibacteria bacterium]